jgi:hypothetical protein
MDFKIDLKIIEKIIPNELITIIFTYIPYHRLVFLNTNYYFAYHTLLKINNIENYTRYIIRNDNSFVFQIIIKENLNKWYKIKKYQYKNIICYDYVSFINYFIIENNANNCKNILDSFVGIGKNEFKKKNILINKRWKH